LAKNTHQLDLFSLRSDSSQGWQKLHTSQISSH